MNVRFMALFDRVLTGLLQAAFSHALPHPSREQGSHGRRLTRPDRFPWRGALGCAEAGPHVLRRPNRTPRLLRTHVRSGATMVERGTVRRSRIAVPTSSWPDEQPSELSGGTASGG